MRLVISERITYVRIRVIQRRDSMPGSSIGHRIPPGPQRGALMGTSTGNGMHGSNDQALICSGNCLEIQDASKLILYYNHYNY